MEQYSQHFFSFFSITELRKKPKKENFPTIPTKIPYKITLFKFHIKPYIKQIKNANKKNRRENTLRTINTKPVNKHEEKKKSSDDLF